MKRCRRRTLAIIVLLGSAAHRMAAAQDIPVHPRELVYPELDFTPPAAARHRHVLPCGVPVHVVEDHELPLVDVGVKLRGGAFLEPPGKAGLASLTGSQMRAGGTARATPEELDEELAYLAANMLSAIDDEDASASFNCLAKDLPRVLELFFDMLRTPRFDAARLELKRSQDLQSLARRNDRTAEIESREWERLLRGDGFHTTERTTKASLEAISREDLLAFHGRLFHPRNFIFTVAGDVQTAAILAQLEAHLKDWARTDWAGGPIPAIPRPATPKPGLFVVDKAGDVAARAGVNQGRVTIGHTIGLRTDPDYHALMVMNHILGGGGFTSRIMSRVRSDEGLAYSAASRCELGVHYSGVFRATFQSKNESVARAASIVLEEIGRIRKEKVTPEELETAINYYVGSFPRLFATPQLVVSTFAEDELTGRDPAFWTTYREKIKGVSADDVLRVAQKHLHPETLVILVVGNQAEMQKHGLKQVGGEGAPIEIPLPDPLTLEYPAGRREP
jgi:predicted Zn-dependent peptidase